MRQILRGIYRMFVEFGINPRKTIHALRGLPYYIRNFCSLRRQMKLGDNIFPLSMPYPCLNDRFLDSGSASGHYFHQDLLIARRIHLNNPIIHVDIGSRLDGFVAHVASFRSIEVIDIRSLSSAIPNVKYIQADLMAPLQSDLVDYCDSLSCLHAMEHFGLGRYGDPVVHDGHILGVNNLHRILKKGGKLYFSVPIGPQRIEFDAHRIFSVGYLLTLFDGKYSIDSFSFVDDQGDLHEKVPLTESNKKNSFGCKFGCGILEMTKL